jgi:hypothetical protein
LNSFPLAWLTKSVPQEYQIRSLPKVCGKHPMTEDM